jgi:hypothetical protein
MKLIVQRHLSLQGKGQNEIVSTFLGSFILESKSNCNKARAVHTN